MSGEVKHAPVPWRTVPSRDRLNPHDVGITIENAQPGSAVLAEVYAEWRAKGDVRPAEAAANADFIVRAVNAHAALVAHIQKDRDAFLDMEVAAAMLHHTTWEEACRVAKEAADTILAGLTS